MAVSRRFRVLWCRRSGFRAFGLGLGVVRSQSWAKGPWPAWDLGMLSGSWNRCGGERGSIVARTSAILIP